MRARVGAAACVAALVAVSGCSDGESQTAPVAPGTSRPAPVEPSPTPTPTAAPPAPSPSPSPLSPFEGDPAVQALRAYLAASSDAINANNLQLPALVALSTSRRQQAHRELFAEDLGTHFPGPAPMAVVGVVPVTPSVRDVRVCLLDGGYALDKPGGRPAEARDVVPAVLTMVLEAGAWKVDDAVIDDGRSCAGVPLPGDPA